MNSGCLGYGFRLLGCYLSILVVYILLSCTNLMEFFELAHYVNLATFGTLFEISLSLVFEYLYAKWIIEGSFVTMHVLFILFLLIIFTLQVEILKLYLTKGVLIHSTFLVHVKLSFSTPPPL